MKKIIFNLLFLIFSVHCFNSTICYAQPISSTQLIGDSQDYDTKEVIYEGEVIEEVMKRETGYWVNVYDGKNCIGVWVPPELVTIIGYAGSYKTQGDIIQITGIFNKACVEHGGDLDIHATSLRKIKSGWMREEKMVPAKRNLLVILSVILCLILILRIFITR